MAQVLYINPDPATQSRATTLGCGWMPTVPPQYRNVAAAPCVILNGAGQTIVLADDKAQATAQAVATALAPILASEQAASDAQAVQQANGDTIRARAATGLAANATYLAIASPSAAQVAAQVRMLTMENSGVIRLLLGQLDSTAGT